MSEKKRKRTYGSGTVSQGHREGTWELRYTPPRSRRLSKTIEAPWTTRGRTHAEDALKDWRKELDDQQNPGVKVPCTALFELHLSEMRRQQRDGKNILDQKRKIKKHLVPFFGHREASSIKLTDIKAYSALVSAPGGGGQTWKLREDPMQSGGVGSKTVILPKISFARLGVAPG
jgi:hypothetical protein